MLRSLSLFSALCIFLAHKIDSTESSQLCDNTCGPPSENEIVKIVIKDHLDTNRPRIFEGNSPYLPQMTISLAMRNLAAASNDSSRPFTFTTKFYVPYGDMVTSINGMAPGPSQYWKMKVNGQSTQCGIDTRILKKGDVVQWSLENFLPNGNQ